MIHTRTKIIATLGLIFFMGCIFVSTLFLHTVLAHKKLYTEKRITQIELQQSNESMKELSQKLKETEVARTHLFTHILKDEDVINFLTLIETLGREQGITLTTSSLNIKPLDDTFEYVVMHIDVVGSYDSVIRLVTLFEKLPYVTTLDTFTIKKQDEENIWNAQFDLRVTKFKKI